MATVGGAPAGTEKGLSALVALMWPTYWLNVAVRGSTEYLADGFTLTNGQFKALGAITMGNKRLAVEFAGIGIDQHGQARVRMRPNLLSTESYYFSS